MRTDFWMDSLSEVTTDMTEDLSIYRFYTAVVGMTDQEYRDFLADVKRGWVVDGSVFYKASA